MNNDLLKQLVSRKSPLAVDGEEYDRRSAYLFFVLHATRERCKYEHAGTTYILEPGEIVVSLRRCAAAFGWSKSRVHRFVDRLVDLGAASRVDLAERAVRDTPTGHPPTVLKLLPRKVLQATTNDVRDTPAGHPPSAPYGANNKSSKGFFHTNKTKITGRPNKEELAKGTEVFNEKKRERAPVRVSARERREVSAAVRRCLWLGDEPPVEDWNIDRALSIYRMLRERAGYSHEDVLGAIEHTRKAVPYLDPGEPATMRVLVNADRVQDVREAVHYGRKARLGERAREIEDAHPDASLVDKMRAALS